MDARHRDRRPDLPKYALANITGGALDTDLRALARELSGRSARALPADAGAEHPLVCLVGDDERQHADEYVLAWKHVRKVVRQAAGPRVGFLWSPYVRSVPETPENASSVLPRLGLRRLRRRVGVQLRHHRRPDLG